MFHENANKLTNHLFDFICTKRVAIIVYMPHKSKLYINLTVLNKYNIIIIISTQF